MIFKKILILALPILFIQCDKGEEISEAKEVELEYSTKQNAIIQDYTSTGCNGCGLWGAPTFNEFIVNHPAVVPIAVHIKYGDPMITDESNDLGNNRIGRKWTPQIAVGHEQSVVLVSNGIDGAKSKVKMQAVYDSIVSQEQKVKVAAAYKADGNFFTMYYGGEVLKEDGSEYLITSYLMQNSLAAFQQGGDSLEVHNHFIRTSTDGAFGKSFTGKMEFKKVIELDPSWDWSKVYSLAIIWKKNGSNYEFVNAIEGTKL